MPRFLLFLLLITILLLPATGAFAQQYSIDQYLDIRYAKNGRFSFDDQWVVYLSNDSGTYQLWKIPVNGGNPQQLTDFPDPVDGFVCSPTKGQIVFQKDKDGNENYQLFQIDLDGKNMKALTDSPENRFNSPTFSPDGKWLAYTANLRDERYFDIYLRDMEAGKAKRLRAVNGYNLIEGWSPDSKNLVVATWENSYNNDLYLVDASSGDSQNLTAHEGWATFSQLAWQPGKKFKKGFYLVSDRGQSFPKLAQYNLKKFKMETLDRAPWDVNNLTLSGDGRVMGYTLNTKGYSRMILIDSKERQFWARPKVPKGVISSLKINKDGTKVVFTFSNAVNNTDLWIYDKTTDKTSRLTYSSTGGIDPDTFIEPHLVDYLGSRNAEIPAFLYFPKGAKQDGTLPCIVYMHGGPEGQERPDFSATFQYFLSRGYVIFAPNIRGSRGYGKVYMSADNVERRIDAIIDAALGVKWLGESKYVDPKRVAVFGGSYGGYMVLALMTEHPTLFAAGIDMVGISNFVTFLERTHPARRKLREAEYGSLSKDKEFLISISPIHKIDRIQGALMVIHGAKDPRVPQHEADQVVEKAKAAGIPVRYLLFEDEGHGLGKLKNRQKAYAEMIEFLDEYLKKPSKQEVEPAKEPAAE